MKISSLTNYINVPSIKQTRNNKTNYLNNPLVEIKDSFTFSAKRKMNNTPSQKASLVGVDIYKNALSESCDLSQIIKSHAQDMKVFPISMVPKTLLDSYYAAYFSAQMDEKFNCSDYKMYIDDKFRFQDKNEALTKAMDVAHEYTHYIQAKNGEEAKFLREISDEWEYFGALSAIVSLLFKKFDAEIQADTLIPFFSNVSDLKDNEKYSRILPKQRNVTREDILKINDYRSMSDFSREMNRIYEIQFRKIIGLIENAPAGKVDPGVSACIINARRNGKINELKEDLRKYCAFNAQKEKEAYLAECQVAKEVLKTRKPINLDVFPLYYDMLYDAFNN